MKTPHKLKHTCLAVAVSQNLFVSANAANIVVNSATDDGNGCTFREALDSVNKVAGSVGNGCLQGDGNDDTIRFNIPSPSTINLSLGDLPLIESELTINGPGQNALTIDGGGQFRLLQASSATLRVSDLSLVDGSKPTENWAAISINDARGSTITNCRISGGANKRGGGISLFESPNTHILNTTVTNGKPILVREFSRSTRIENSTISNNLGSTGGGVFVNYSPGVEIRNTTISGNTATVDGSSVFFAVFSGGVIENSTIVENVGLNDAVQVGAIGTLYYSNNLAIRNSIISGNITEASGVAPSQVISAVHGDRDGPVRITSSNSIFGDSAATYAELFPDRFRPSASDIITSGDRTNIALAAIVQPLSFNGGPTKTHALTLDSIAVNSGSNLNCPSTDQRGFFRFRNSNNPCDIGAFEYVAPDTSSFFVVPTKNGKTVILNL